MYERREKDVMSQAAGSGTAGILRAAADYAQRDRSPVDEQLDRKTRLNEELAVAVSELISDIRKIMRHDPRELVRPEEAKGSAAGPSCELEASLFMLNEGLEQQITLLRQVRGVLCL